MHPPCSPPPLCCLESCHGPAQYFLSFSSEVGESQSHKSFIGLTSVVQGIRTKFYYCKLALALMSPFYKCSSSCNNNSNNNNNNNKQLCGQEKVTANVKGF